MFLGSTTDLQRFLQNEEKVIEGYKMLGEFFQVMTDYLTTDLNGESLL